MIITQTPLRVSFLGGNTDFSEYYTKFGGMVLTTAIDKFVYCIVKARFDDLIIVNYTVKETVTRVDNLKHELVREALKLLGIKRGIEISFLSDIPTRGTGLGSSSSVTVGVLKALHRYLGDDVDAEQLAREAIGIEVDILKKPIGVQDQYIVAFGGLRKIEFRKNGEVKIDHIPLPGPLREDFDNSLMLFYTGISRKSSSILSTLNIKKNLPLLHKNMQLANQGYEVLPKGNLVEFGQLLDDYWAIKKQLSGRISNEEIDNMYEMAMEAGAVGGKILGAGGGGFLLLMVPENRRGEVREKLRTHKELPFMLEKDGSKIIFNIRRYK